MLLEADAVTQRAGRRVLLGPVDLALVEGEFLAVLGANGAGKTTLLRLLSGVATRTLGDVRFRGRPLASIAARERAQSIAYVPQVRPTSVPLTVRQLVLLGRYPHFSRWQRTPSPADVGAVDRALDRVGLAALSERKLDRLSGGERQAAYLAAALATVADVLVLDEPTTHLDPHHQVDLVRLLRELHAEGRTIVLATHDLALAALLADRIVVLARGRIAAIDRVEAIVRAERLAELFGAPFIVTEGEGGRSIPRLVLDGAAGGSGGVDRA